MPLMAMWPVSERSMKPRSSRALRPCAPGTRRRSRFRVVSKPSGMQDGYDVDRCNDEQVLAERFPAPPRKRAMAGLRRGTPARRPNEACGHRSCRRGGRATGAGAGSFRCRPAGSSSTLWGLVGLGPVRRGACRSNALACGACTSRASNAKAPDHEARQLVRRVVGNPRDRAEMTPAVRRPCPS